jgi:hypothetical protein
MNNLTLSQRKGGDLNKYEQQPVDYLLGVDLSHVAIKDARDRFANGRSPFRFRADFFTSDCFVVLF